MAWPGNYRALWRKWDSLTIQDTEQRIQDRRYHIGISLYTDDRTYRIWIVSGEVDISVSSDIRIWAYEDMSISLHSYIASELFHKQAFRIWQSFSTKGFTGQSRIVPFFTKSGETILKINFISLVIIFTSSLSKYEHMPIQLYRNMGMRLYEYMGI